MTFRLGWKIRLMLFYEAVSIVVVFCCGVNGFKNIPELMVGPLIFAALGILVLAAVLISTASVGFYYGRKENLMEED